MKKINGERGYRSTRISEHESSSRLQVLPRDYSAEELDEGAGMAFHPHNGCKFDMWYDLQGKNYYYDVIRGWGQVLVNVVHLPPIGDGRDHRAGDPIPEHWLFDPYVGLPIEGRT